MPHFDLSMSVFHKCVREKLVQYCILIRLLPSSVSATPFFFFQKSSKIPLDSLLLYSLLLFNK